jgi:hypothetical protein
MLRLTFLSDVGYLAPDNDDVASLRDLPESAALAVDEVDFPALMKWMVRKGWEAAMKAFPRARYEALARKLRDPDVPSVPSDVIRARKPTKRRPVLRKSPPRRRKVGN